MTARHRMAYLAYPIDQATQDQGFGQFVDRVAHGLINADQVDLVFDPGEAFVGTGSADLGPEVAGINAYAASQADVVVAFMPVGVPSIGVPMEVDRAVLAGKHVVIFTDARSWMLQYQRPNVIILDRFDIAYLNDVVLWLSVRSMLTTGDLRDPLPVIVDPGGRLPYRGHADDAGLDLYVSEETIIEPAAFADVPCSVRMELPEWSWGLILGRSSTLRDRHLMVQPAVIDPGWRGTFFVAAWNLSSDTVHIDKGDRIGQLIIMPNLTKDFKPISVDALTPHERGDRGFGSTGR